MQNNVEKFKAMGAAPDDAQKVHDLLEAQKLGITDLWRLLPLILKYLPMIREFIKELQGAEAAPK